MVTISQLFRKTTPEDTDWLVIEDASGVTRKISRGDFLLGVAPGGSALSEWFSVPTGADYSAPSNARLIVQNDTYILSLPSNPNLGAEVEFISLNSSPASPRAIAGLTLFESESVIGANIIAKGKAAKLIYLGGTSGWVASVGGVFSPKYATVPLTWQSNGDTNGLVYYLGSNKKTESFINPVDRGAISLTQSSTWQQFEVKRLTDRVDNTFHTNTATNQWAKLNILLPYRLIVNRYTWKGRSDSTAHIPRNWKLQGSLDDLNWVDLDTQTNNTAIGQNTWGSFPVSGQTVPYKYFRFLQTGANSSGELYLTGGEWELYGDLVSI